MTHNTLVPNRRAQGSGPQQEGAGKGLTHPPLRVNAALFTWTRLVRPCQGAVSAFAAHLCARSVYAGFPERLSAPCALCCPFLHLSQGHHEVCCRHDSGPH